MRHSSDVVNLENLPMHVSSILRSICGDGSIPLHEPVFKGNEWLYTKECLDSSYVSSVGKFVDKFERALESYTGAKYAVAVVNGTAALHIALLLAGVCEGDEVLVPALTFVATANAVRYCGAIPHFVDSDERTLGIDPAALNNWLEKETFLSNGACINKRTGRTVRVLLPMHVFGHPCDLNRLLEIATKFELTLVEDAAESLGSWYFGKHTGTIGLLGTLSFNGNKTITTGGGGAILTNDAKLAQRAKFLTTTAKQQHPWLYEHSEVGFNYRMPNLNAALGCAQLEQLPNFLSAKRELFARYKAGFSSISCLHLLEEPSGSLSNYWLQTLILDEHVAEWRDAILQQTNSEGLMTRPSWALLPDLAPYQDCCTAPLPVAKSLDKRLINIPSSVNLV